MASNPPSGGSPVRLTFDVPTESAEQLTALIQSQTHLLQELGILSLQIQGQDSVALPELPPSAQRRPASSEAGSSRTSPSARPQGESLLVNLLSHRSPNSSVKAAVSAAAAAASSAGRSPARPPSISPRSLSSGLKSGLLSPESGLDDDVVRKDGEKSVKLKLKLPVERRNLHKSGSSSAGGGSGKTPSGHATNGPSSASAAMGANPFAGLGGSASGKASSGPPEPKLPKLILSMRDKTIKMKKSNKSKNLPQSQQTASAAAAGSESGSDRLKAEDDASSSPSSRLTAPPVGPGSTSEKYSANIPVLSASSGLDSPKHPAMNGLDDKEESVNSKEKGISISTGGSTTKSSPSRPSPSSVSSGDSGSNGLEVGHAPSLTTGLPTLPYTSSSNCEDSGIESNDTQSDKSPCHTNESLPTATSSVPGGNNKSDGGGGHGSNNGGLSPPSSAPSECLIPSSSSVAENKKSHNNSSPSNSPTSSSASSPPPPPPSASTANGAANPSITGNNSPDTKASSDHSTSEQQQHKVNGSGPGSPAPAPSNSTKVKVAAAGASAANSRQLVNISASASPGMVPVKLVTVSGEGNVRLVRVSPVKAAGQGQPASAEVRPATASKQSVVNKTGVNGLDSEKSLTNGEIADALLENHVEAGKVALKRQASSTEVEAPAPKTIKLNPESSLTVVGSNVANHKEHLQKATTKSTGQLGDNNSAPLSALEVVNKVMRGSNSTNSLPPSTTITPAGSAASGAGARAKSGAKKSVLDIADSLKSAAAANAAAAALPAASTAASTATATERRSVRTQSSTAKAAAAAAAAAAASGTTAASTRILQSAAAASMAILKKAAPGLSVTSSLSVTPVVVPMAENAIVEKRAAGKIVVSTPSPMDESSAAGIIGGAPAAILDGGRMATRSSRTNDDGPKRRKTKVDS